ncbi:hypothetical protein DXT76_03530 [Halobacillus trueperi]|uniref:Flagellar hook-length control protein FliK n=1 Tax=Halobacillus trueperi TaxID=156205 RepID=A0A3D8VSF7_9BACI|nr:hypothetical protein [Halobacillus trueperi]RDY72173.1 hypothetical protein DXT76_03530 [Halobacillus trueperi]
MDHLINSLTRLSTHAALPVEPKSGQLVKGKVIQSLQDNKVVVNMGKKSVEAIVNQPLIKGSSYLFQVEQVEPALVLRTVSLSEARPGQLDLASLIKQIGVKENKDNLSLMKAIVDLKVPLHKKDLTQAFKLIQSSANQPLARELLLHIISRKMPIQSSVYSALSAKYTEEYSQVLSDVEQQLGKKSLSASDEKIKSMVQTLRAEQIPKSESVTLNKLKYELMNGSSSTFELLKKAGIIDAKHTLSSFQQNWSHQNPGMDRLPFTKERVASSLQQLLQNQLPLSPSENQTIKQWVHTSEKLLSVWAQQPSNTDFHMVSQQTRRQWTETFRNVVAQNVMRRLTPHLQESTKFFIDKAVTLLGHDRGERNSFSRTEFRSFLSDMQNLIGKQVSIDQQKLLVHSLQSLSQNITLSDKDRMWLQMKAMMSRIGFNDEHVLAKAFKQTEAPVQTESSLKTLLLKGLNEGSEVKAETANRLINLINGTQLASYSDNPQTLQITLQFPSDFIGALKDVHMNMEGRKNDDGQIDSDYCHVMFYLHLSQLEETIIDLNIVERRVSVVVYNENPELEKLFKPYQKKLEEGLEIAGYELNSLRARVTSEVSKSTDSNKQEEAEEGVDIRI